MFIARVLAFQVSVYSTSDSWREMNTICIVFTYLFLFHRLECVVAIFSNHMKCIFLCAFIVPQRLLKKQSLDDFCSFSI